MVWDILHTISADYILLTKYKIGIPTIIYFISRFVIVGFPFLLHNPFYQIIDFGVDINHHYI